jgi:PAS domain S-box-containing protein
MKADVPRPRLHERLGHLVDAARMPVLVAISYWLGAKAAFLVGTLSDQIFAPFWPPNIVLLCALLLVPTRRWWLCILAAFPAHAVAELEIGMDAPQLLVAFATNCMVALLNAFGVRKILGQPPWFDTLNKAALYVLITAVASPALSALGGAFVPILGGGAINDYWLHWLQWFASNALGSVTLGPILLIWLSEYRWRLGRAPIWSNVEGLLLGLVLLFFCMFAFELATRALGRGLVPALLYLPLPLVLWAALRFGVKGASSAVMIVTVVLIWRALNGPSLFSAEDPETNVFGMQAFLLGLAIPILLLGAAIEETRTAEQAVRESEDRMAFAAASANVCLWHFNRKTDRVWMTAHGRRMFGFGTGETITRSAVVKAIHPDDRDAAIAALRSAAIAGQLADNEFRIVRRNGEVRWIRARARTHSNDHGEQTFVSGTFADVTDRRAIEQEAASQRRELAHLTRVAMLGELSAGIAHELTQPLTAILSNAQAARLILADSAPDLGEITEMIEDIISEDNRAGEVIHRLRGLMKKGEPQYEPVDLNEVVHSTLRLLHSELIGRRAKIRTDLATELPLASGDAVQLQQVLLNLMMNALEAMTDVAPSGRIVLISTRATGNGYIEVSVADHGVGFASLRQPYLAQPFFTTKEGGLGLGLSICSSILKSHGGKLDLVNNPNGGATARFRLPEHQVVTGEVS